MALQIYDEIIELNPDILEVWHNRGNALIIIKYYEEALKSFNEALELKPNFAEAWYGKGHCLINMKKYEEALQALNESFKDRARKVKRKKRSGLCSLMNRSGPIQSILYIINYLIFIRVLSVL